VTAGERLLLDSAMSAASVLIGTSLTVVGEPFAGGDRSVVVRARRSDTHETVVVKGYDAGRAGEGWAREAAALTALAGLRTGAPALVAATASPQVVVMEDLGPGGSVATALLAPIRWSPGKRWSTGLKRWPTCMLQPGTTLGGSGWR
jgi:hypothetical protein